MSELESWFKRMVTNAKEYHHKTSQNFDDAERVRKALSNYMTKTNPAYKKIPGYSCQAVPIPEDGEVEVGPEPEADQDAEGEDEDAEGEEEDAEGEDESDEDENDDDEEDDEDEDEGPRRRKKIILKRTGSSRSARNGSTPSRRTTDRSSRAKPDHEYEGVPYKGLNFQQAQEKIVEELIRKSSDGVYVDPCHPLMYSFDTNPS